MRRIEYSHDLKVVSAELWWPARKAGEQLFTQELLSVKSCSPALHAGEQQMRQLFLASCTRNFLNQY